MPVAQLPFGLVFANIDQFLVSDPILFLSLAAPAVAVAAIVGKPLCKMLQGDLQFCTGDVIAFDEDKTRLVSSSYLGGYDLGVERAIAYFVQHHIDSRFSTTRSEDDVSLKLLPTTHNQRAKDLEITRIIRLSVSVDELRPLSSEFPRKKLVEELDHLRRFCFPEMPEYKESHGRPRLLDAFCQYRKRYFELHPEVFEEVKESLEHLDLSDASSSEVERSTQVQSPIYSLDEQTKALFR